MTFPTGVIEIRKCSNEELKAMLDEAREASKHSRKLGRVMGIVAAHRRVIQRLGGEGMSQTCPRFRRGRHESSPSRGLI